MVFYYMGYFCNFFVVSVIFFCSVIFEFIFEVNEKEYEINWRSMVEMFDGLELLEMEKVVFCIYSFFEKFSRFVFDISLVGKQLLLVVGSIILVLSQGKFMGDKDELKLDDLEWVFQQSIEIGFLDGSCWDFLNFFIISIISIFVFGMFEEEEDEEEEEEDYSYEFIVEEVQFNSRIEFWVFEIQRIMEILQFGKVFFGLEEDSVE